MRLLCLLLAVVMLAPAQVGDQPPVVLPSGKLQRDEIHKLEHKRNAEDAAKLLQLSQDIKDAIDQSGDYSVSMKTLKQLDEIEKLTKNIRGRIKHS